MKDVLEQKAGGGPYAELGAYVAAALLNCAAGKTPYLSHATIRKMWNDVLSKGFYEPVSNVQWDVTKVAEYLKSTMR